MAVAQGYGKTVTSGSVFAYDVADTRNSYIGEPTTNLALFSVISGIAFNADYGGTITQTADYVITYKGRPSLKLVSTSQWNIYKYPRSGNYTATSSTVFTFSWKMKWSDGRVPVLNNGYIYTDAQYFYPSVTVTAIEDGWYFCQVNTSGTNSPLWLTGFDCSQIGTCYITDWQAEAKSHATPFTPAGTTRSSTQGLLPLVGNSTIDLTNVSFDSNAQISLDGSSDYVKIAQNSNFYTNEWAWEMVVKFTANTGTYQGLVWAEGDTGGGSGLQYLLTLYNHSYFHYRINNATTGWTNTDTSAIDFIPSNYNHIVFQFKNGTTSIYINGKMFHTDSTRGAYSGGTNSPMFIGARNDGAYSSAIRPDVIKAYNRVLSATEIKQNFDFYDARFGIEIESTYYFAVSNRFTRLKRRYLDAYDVQQLIQGKTMASTTPAYILYQKPNASFGGISTYTQLASDPIGTPSRITVLGSQTSYSNGRYLTTVNVHKSKKGGRLTFEFPNGGTTQYGEAFYKTIVTPYVP